jgi:hypothetical protein
MKPSRQASPISWDYPFKNFSRYIPTENEWKPELHKVVFFSQIMRLCNIGN